MRVVPETPRNVLGTPIPDKARLLLWALMIVDVMAAAWMLSAGEWLDRASAITAVVTLGGHHLLVLWLAVVGFATLAVVAIVTKAFAVAGRWHFPLLALGALASVVAASGALSVALLVVGVVLLVAVIGYAFVGGRLLFLGGLFRRR